MKKKAMIFLPILCIMFSACINGDNAIQKAEEAISAQKYDQAKWYAQQALLSAESEKAQILLRYIQNGDLMLVAAFWENDKEALSYLAGIVHDINIQCPRFKTPVLVLAAAWGHTDLVKILLDAGADPNHAADKDGLTALMWSAKHFDEQLEMTQALLEAGANVDEISNYGETALQIAEIYKNPNIVNLLKQYGAKE